MVPHKAVPFIEKKLDECEFPCDNMFRETNLGCFARDY